MHTNKRDNVTPRRPGHKKGWPTVCTRVSPEDYARIDAAVARGRYPHRDALVNDAVLRLVQRIEDDRRDDSPDAGRRGYQLGEATAA